MSQIQNRKNRVSYDVISPDQAQRRIDNYLLSVLKGLPKSRIYQMLRRGEIRVNGGRVKQDYRIKQGDKVRIPPVRLELSPELVPRDYLMQRVGESVLFEDENLIVLNKPAGIVVHSGSGRTFGVIEIMRYLRPAEKDMQLVHRLDKETSGCLLIAKNIPILRQLHIALKKGSIEKQYLALLKGHLEQAVLEVDQSLLKSTKHPREKKVKVSNLGKYSLTRFELREKFQSASLVNVQLFTGRTHQIRVHAQYLQHPVAGDNKYGDKIFNKTLKSLGLKRLFLHASSLRIPLSSRNKSILVKAPLPDELTDFLSSYA